MSNTVTTKNGNTEMRQCFIKNLKQSYRKRRVRYWYDAEKLLYCAIEGEITHFFAEKARGFSLYKHGLQTRANQLFSSYLLDQIIFTKDDIVIDCGANYGDLYLALQNKILPQNYVSFEPGLDEFKCLQLNAPGSTNFNLGLSDESGERDFFISSAGADSSVIQPKKHTSVLKIQTITLDEYYEKNNLDTVKLLKLEAEGFEPEILDGAGVFLNHCEFVAIDGFYERGINEEETFCALTNKLCAAGFVMFGVNLKRGRALFRIASR